MQSRTEESNFGYTRPESIAIRLDLNIVSERNESKKVGEEEDGTEIKYSKRKG